MSKSYVVRVLEVHCQEYSVDADSPDHALELADAESASTDNIELEYCHTLPKEQWIVFERQAHGALNPVILARVEELEQGDYSGLVSYQEGLDFTDLVLGTDPDENL